MEVFSSYTSAFQSILESKQFSLAHLHALQKNTNIDTYGCYKIFYCISGSKLFHIGRQSYPCNPGDLFLISPSEWHYFSDFEETSSQERVVLFIYPDYLRQCSSKHTDLSLCFNRAEMECSHKISLNAKEQEQFLRYIHQLSKAGEFGQDLLDRSFFIALLVFLNRLLFSHEDPGSSVDIPVSSRPLLVDDALVYIQQHLAEDLSAAALADHFFVSSTYLCRMFREATGTTLHKYITAQRITQAKDLLINGASVATACTACGFNDYGNFIKTFTKSVGVSPKKYGRISKT